MKNVSKALIWFYYKLHRLSRNFICDVGWTPRVLVLIHWHYANSRNKLCFYQRDIASKRLLTSIGIGIITSIVLIIVQLIFSLISSELSYASLIKELSRTGVYFKWQMLITLIFVIPCHELYMRTVLQKELIRFNLPKWVSILIVAICSSSLFIYLDNWWIVFFIFVTQIILSLSYEYTRRIATTSIAQIVAIILLLIFHG